MTGSPGWKLSICSCRASVLWNDNYYNYMLITQLSMEETIQIAESVTIAPESSYHPPELAR